MTEYMEPARPAKMKQVLAQIMARLIKDNDALARSATSLSEQLATARQDVDGMAQQCKELRAERDKARETARSDRHLYVQAEASVRSWKEAHDQQVADRAAERDLHDKQLEQAYAECRKHKDRFVEVEAERDRLVGLLTLKEGESAFEALKSVLNVNQALQENLRDARAEAQQKEGDLIAHDEERDALRARLRKVNGDLAKLREELARHRGVSLVLNDANLVDAGGE